MEEKTSYVKLCNSDNGGVDKTRNTEHSGTCRNIPEHEKIKIIFMKKKNRNNNTNINHKGLQRTANEYAEERGIYKYLISKNNIVDILNSASRILQCWSYYVKINSARHQHDTKNSKRSGIVAIDSCFALFGARQFGVTTRDQALMKNIRELWF